MLVRRTLQFLTSSSLALVACFGASACSSYRLSEPHRPITGFDPIATGRGRVCVLRTSPMAQAVVFPVHDDGVLVGATRGPSSFCYDAQPGKHVIVTRADEPAYAEIEVEAGRVYWLEQQVDNIFGYVKCRPTWVNDATARELAPYAPPRVLTSVPGRDRLPPALPYAPAMAPFVVPPPAVAIASPSPTYAPPSSREPASSSAPSPAAEPPQRQTTPSVTGTGL